jgi:DNA-binding PadR family transcriptional regulator
MAYKTLVAASTKPIILSILSHGKSYGYQIIKNIEQLSNGELAWTDAMLYPVLHRMEKEGLIKSEWMILENGRKRKYYFLTPQGRKERDVTKKQWINVNSALTALWGVNPKLELA